MRTRCIATGLLAAFGVVVRPSLVLAQGATNTPVETRVPAPGGSLYARVIGRGPAVIVLHGGPDFDQSYLLPELDRLANVYRLFYYDQRGRGRSAEGVRAADRV